jgi:hypothetical protein
MYSNNRATIEITGGGGGGIRLEDGRWRWCHDAVGAVEEGRRRRRGGKMAAWVWRRGDGSGGLEEGRQQRGRRGGATYGRGRGGRGSEERYTNRRRGPIIGPISVAHQASCVTERYNFVANDNTCAAEIVKPMIGPDRGGAHHISVAHVRGVCHINQLF